MRGNIIYFLILVFPFAGCKSPVKSQLIVAVAANVQFAMEELKSEFEKENNISVTIVLGSSGKLATQIEQGAPYDVFVSADIIFPRKLYEDGLAVRPPQIYTNGVLVLWTAKNGKLTTDLLQSLRIAKKIAIPNPKTAPYGIAAEEVLKYYNIYDIVKDKLVYGESISQTNMYIISQAADLGFTAKSVVLSAEMKNKGYWMDVDAKSYHSIQQAAVLLKHGNTVNEDASAKFYNYLYSRAAKNIFKKYGYLIN
jgi:molybdate transport system substrate-binding protein